MLKVNRRTVKELKLSTQAQWIDLIAWQAVETPVCWAIWNGVVAKVFDLPNLAYWQVMVILLAIGMIFPTQWGFLMLRMADGVQKIANYIGIQIES